VLVALGCDSGWVGGSIASPSGCHINPHLGLDSRAGGEKSRAELKVEFINLKK